MDISNIKYIYYRGIAKDCNYDCSYCILEKSNNKNRLNDERYLNKFVNYIRKTKFTRPVSIMFTPHGEALTKEYYYKAIAKLTQVESVAFVSCQTNGSFSFKKFTQRMEEHNVNYKKLALWVTYHPETLGNRIYDFSNKIIELSSKVKISLGVVGLKEYRSEIATIHNSIPPRVHYWINKPNGVKTQPSELFEKIDKNYRFENNIYKCEIDNCRAGVDSIVVKEKGEVYMCHQSRKSIGNLYENEKIIREKSAPRCDCFLTYSQRTDINFPIDLHRFRFKKEI